MEPQILLFIAYAKPGGRIAEAPPPPVHLLPRARGGGAAAGELGRGEVVAGKGWLVGGAPVRWRLSQGCWGGGGSMITSLEEGSGGCGGLAGEGRGGAGTLPAGQGKPHVGSGWQRRREGGGGAVAGVISVGGSGGRRRRRRG